MATKPATTNNGRVFFTKDDTALPLPNLMAHQKDSWQEFVETGLSEIFAELNPIEDYTGQKLELRFLLPNARVMIHQPSSGTQGKISDQEITLREGIYLKKRLNEILAKNTGQKLSKIEKDVDRDFWMSAEESVAYGLADKVVTKA